MVTLDRWYYCTRQICCNGCTRLPGKLINADGVITEGPYAEIKEMIGDKLSSERIVSMMQQHWLMVVQYLGLVVRWRLEILWIFKKYRDLGADFS